MRRSPLQNRVLPTGEIVADASYRGDFMGNRGILHDVSQRLGAARWRHKAWICCSLSFKGRHREVMQPGQYTELFFLDEAVALAAGHRPCAECRRTDYNRFRDAWAVAHGTLPRAPEMDAVLHPARVTRARAQARHLAEAGTLPDGAFILWNAVPWLIRHEQALPFRPTGYGAARARPAGQVELLTPAPTVAVLAAGYRPVLHVSAAH
jgi:hypothetical protein